MIQSGRAESVIQLTGYGGASACLMLRIPLTRRDLPRATSNRVPADAEE
jgi:hypothetical protein